MPSLLYPGHRIEEIDGNSKYFDYWIDSQLSFNFYNKSVVELAGIVRYEFKEVKKSSL